jgi:Fur family peroxide stress response transcriptional regulator
MVYRKSKQKESILKALKQTTSHPDADWVYRQVKKDIPNISLGTIYRNLKVLKDSGVIRGVGLAGGIEHFDAKTAKHNHFRCNHCGRIFDLEGELDPRIEKRIAARTGFKVTGHRLEFSGLCRECQDARKRN